MKRVAGIVALAAMLTLAGCNGILGGDQQNTSNSTNEERRSGFVQPCGVA